MIEKINKKFYWPKYNSKLLKDENCKIVVQVDGRKRGILEMPTNSKEIIVIKKSKRYFCFNTRIPTSIMPFRMVIFECLIEIITCHMTE